MSQEDLYYNKYLKYKYKYVNLKKQSGSGYESLLSSASKLASKSGSFSSLGKSLMSNPSLKSLSLDTLKNPNAIKDLASKSGFTIPKNLEQSLGKMGLPSSLGSLGSLGSLSPMANSISTNTFGMSDSEEGPVVPIVKPAPRPLPAHMLTPPVNLEVPDLSSKNIVNLKKEELIHELENLLSKENEIHIRKLNKNPNFSRPDFISLAKTLIHSSLLIADSDGTIDLPSNTLNINESVKQLQNKYPNELQLLKLILTKKRQKIGQILYQTNPIILQVQINKPLVSFLH